MTPDATTTAVLQSLDRISDQLGQAAAPKVADVNAMSVDQLVALQESDPALYQRSLSATAATPAAPVTYAEAPADVIPAARFNALRADQLADVQAADPALYARTVEHWAANPMSPENGQEA